MMLAIRPLLLSMILALTGCGQKGPLYLPEQAPAQPDSTETSS